MTIRLAHPAYQVLMAVVLCTHQGIACGQAASGIQAGRTVQGSVILTDQPLAAGVTPVPLALEPLMRLPEETPRQPPPGSAATTGRAPTADSTSKPSRTAEQRATCRDVNQRYNEAHAELTLVERKKAAGTLLIPESGMVTLRQHLATLERMRQLCQ